jgi:hypothetical protein
MKVPFISAAFPPMRQGRPVIRDWSWTDLPRLARFIKRCRPDAITLLYSGWIYNDHPMITFAPTLCA